MKRVILMIVLVIFPGCGGETIEEPTDPIETEIRSMVDLPKGELTATHYMKVTGISIYSNDPFGKKVKDLSLLAKCTQLKSINITNGNIEDLSPLVGLTKLEVIDLQSNQISDLFPLAKLRNLRKLWIGNNRIKDLSPLANLTKLQEILINDNKVADLSPLAELTELKRLYLSNNKCTDLSALMGLKKLKGLRLGLPNLPQAEVDKIRDALPECKITGY